MIGKRTRVFLGAALDYLHKKPKAPCQNVDPGRAEPQLRVLPIHQELIPVAFREPAEAHQRVCSLVHERFGPSAEPGKGIVLSLPGSTLPVPHKAMWYKPKDAAVLETVRDVVGILETYSPEAFRTHVGYVERDRTRKYLEQTAIRVAQLIDTLDRMALPPGSRILEIGALFGSFAVALARLGYRVTAVDRYETFGGALDGYTELMQREGIEVISTNRETEVRTIGQLPRFDCTIAMAVIEHIPHTPRIFLEMMLDRTGPGGIIALDTPNLTRFWNRKRLSENESVFQDLKVQYECEPPYEGHHREYTAAEMHWLLDHIGCTDIRLSLFDYNMLQFSEISGPHVECLAAILGDLTCADTILACGRRS
jgi:2-polyprenyl-3-methyl-5-hydroxy-6-metoxy-1,4-benzoquinol methylase